MTSADYLNQLIKDKSDLVDNLTEKGIEGLTGNETFTELVPEVLNIKSGGNEWERPSDWWDTETILSEAEVKDGLYPAYILLFADTDKTTNFTEVTTYKNLRGAGYLTSDGAWYLASDGEAIHTWDTTKDKECSLGYKTRYVIVYVADKTNIGGQIILKKDVPCLEFVAGDITLANDGLIFGDDLFYNANNQIMSIKYTNDTTQPTIAVSSFAGHCNNLKNISLPTLEIANSSGMFTACNSLTNISLPSLTMISNSDIFSYCYALTNINLPALTTINDMNAFFCCFSLTNISLPALTAINSDYAFASCFSLTNISLPALTTINAIGAFSWCYALTNISLPVLTTINGNGQFEDCYALTSVSLPVLTAIENDAINTFSGCNSLTEYEFNSELTTVQLTNIFNKCYFLKRIGLFNGWKFSGLNATDCNLTVDSLNDMLDKLADVSSESGTYTLTLGATNLAKLTAEEIAVGTDKGWTIA